MNWKVATRQGNFANSIPSCPVYPACLLSKTQKKISNFHMIRPNKSVVSPTHYPLVIQKNWKPWSLKVREFSHLKHGGFPITTCLRDNIHHRTLNVPSVCPSLRWISVQIIKVSMSLNDYDYTSNMLRDLLIQYQPPRNWSLPTAWAAPFPRRSSWQRRFQPRNGAGWNTNRAPAAAAPRPPSQCLDRDLTDAGCGAWRL